MPISPPKLADKSAKSQKLKLKSEHNKAGTERIQVIVQIENAHTPIAGAGSCDHWPGGQDVLLDLETRMDFWDTVSVIITIQLLEIFSLSITFNCCWDELSEMSKIS